MTPAMTMTMSLSLCVPMHTTLCEAPARRGRLWEEREHGADGNGGAAPAAVAATIKADVLERGHGVDGSGGAALAAGAATGWLVTRQASP